MRRLAACSAAVLALVPFTSAHAVANPGFAATTRVGGTVLPVPFATGSWTVTAGGTSVALHVAMPFHPAPADTSVAASWTSPFARARGRCFGQYDFGYKNWRVTLPTPHFADRVRYREQGGRWSRWFTEWEADYEDVDPDLAVGRRLTDDCVFLLPRVPRRPVQLEIQHAGHYVGTHQIEEDLKVRVP
jgi:hypothetical protein